MDWIVYAGNVCMWFDCLMKIWRFGDLKLLYGGLVVGLGMRREERRGNEREAKERMVG